MLKIGYKLMSEEHGPAELIRNGQRAEKAGFDFAAISDHYFPGCLRRARRMSFFRLALRKSATSRWRR